MSSLLTHNPPTSTYNGLTIIMSNPSRHDTKKLLSGNAGDFFWSSLYPYIREETDIRTPDVKLPLLKNTKVVLLLGDYAVSLYNTNSLNEIRGCPFSISEEQTYIASYQPQDAFDIKSYDKEDEESDTEDKDDTGKGHGKTKRSNWRFWLYYDLRKTIKLLRGENKLSPNYSIKLYPNSQEICEVLRNTSESYLYLDIETDRNFNLTCIGISFLSKESYRNGKDFTVFVIPWKRYNNTLAYTPENCRKIIQALAVAMSKNTVIIHNSMFDLFVLMWKYKIPPPKSKNIIDTMILWHRCYPEVEKSLGHLISYFLFETYHKSEGVYEPKNIDQEQALWNYNAKDIIRMIQIHWGLIDEMEKLKTTESCMFACRFVRPYLTMMLQGTKLDVEKLKTRYADLEFHAKVLIRCLKIVTGLDINPRSSQQVSKYLYETLRLPCPDEEKPTNKKTLLKLLTKHNVPSVKIMLAIRAKRKAASSLKYVPWGVNGDRFTTAYNITGTDTYRLGSRALLKFKPFKGYGGNFQNWDKELRDLIIAD